MSALERLRDHEAARIARWFRETGCGLAYYDRRGRAWPISEQERERFQAKALKQLDHFLAEHHRTPFETMLIAIVLFAAFGLASAWFGDWLPLLSRIPAPLAAVPAVLWPMVNAWRFKRAQARLRREIAERLMLRRPLPAAVAAAGRRYNIFAAGQAAAALSALAVAAAATFRGERDYGGWPFFALIALAWLLYWAARRVDATHRRKPG